MKKMVFLDVGVGVHGQEHIDVKVIVGVDEN